MTGPCLGEVAAALIDGELDHAARERAQRHLAHCPTCRAEVEAHRSLKVRLARLNLDAPAPGVALTDRLLALSVPGTDRIGAAGLVPGAPVTVRPAAGPRAGRPPGRPPGRARRLRHRIAAASALAALGVVALALGSPNTTPSTPVDPATDTFVVQHVDTTSETPRVVRATLTGGSARPPR